MSSARIIVPHRGLSVAKTRLASVLEPHERTVLARRLLARVLNVARDAIDDVVVISPASDLQQTVADAGARLVVQRGMGLNAGLDQARGDAQVDGIETLVVLHGDLPNLSVEDVLALLAGLGAGGGGSVAIAPDRTGAGTNGLGLRPAGAIPFRFGTGSFAAHLSEAQAAGAALSVVERPGLAFDLDTPGDLARWLELGDAA